MTEREKLNIALQNILWAGKTLQDWMDKQSEEITNKVEIEVGDVVNAAGEVWDAVEALTS